MGQVLQLQQRSVTMAEFPVQQPAREGCAPQRRPERSACCIRPDVPIDRPDPAIYSQKRALATESPTWDNPDILTNSWPAPWTLFLESQVIVHNLSPTVSAANVQVDVGFSAFGIGMPVTALSSRFVSLAPSSHQTLYFPLPQAMLAGDPLVSVFVRIVHSADADIGNNEGEQAIIGGATSVLGRTIGFDFPVRNPASYPQAMTFVSYANALGLTVTPAEHSFAPFEQIMVHGGFTVEPDLHGSPSAALEYNATVAAFGAGGALIGGLTFVLSIDD